MSDLKKYKKFIAITIVFAAVVCTVILADVFAKDGKTLPAYSQQAGEPGNDSSASTILQTGGTAVPTQTSGMALDMQDTTAVINTAESTGELLQVADIDQNQDRQAVTTLVEDFGKKLQMVSLLAPKDVAAKSIEDNYGGYVTPELLKKWMADPQSALGRMGSSPWPDRIDILDIKSVGNDQYSVTGEIIEITSVEFVNGGAAARRPIELTVQKADGHWLISSVKLGEYLNRGPVKYENKQYGFDFYLPETWKGYTIVAAKWEGTSGSDIVETGPQLLIRNPAWTQKDPHQDIPIMVFTTEQWNALQNEKFFVSAAPIGPSKLGSNSEYVFALPPRYNFAFPTGYEEVEKIMNGSPLWPTKSGMNC